MLVKLGFMQKLSMRRNNNSIANSPVPFMAAFSEAFARWASKAGTSFTLAASGLCGRLA